MLKFFFFLIIKVSIKKLWRSWCGDALGGATRTTYFGGRTGQTWCPR